MNNTLIIGGLALLVIVALVGVIILGIDEERLEKQRKAESAASAPSAKQAEAPRASVPEIPATKLPPAVPDSEESLTATRLSNRPEAETLSSAVPPSVGRTSEVLPPLDQPPTLPGIAASTPSARELHASRHLPPSLHKAGPFVPFDGDQPAASASYKDEAAAMLREEIQAMSGEVRLLIQRASEMEQRLNTLSDALTRRQQSQNGMAARVPMPGGEARE